MADEGVELLDEGELDEGEATLESTIAAVTSVKLLDLTTMASLCGLVPVSPLFCQANVRFHMLLIRLFSFCALSDFSHTEAALKGRKHHATSQEVFGRRLCKGGGHQQSLCTRRFSSRWHR